MTAIRLPHPVPVRARAIMRLAAMAAGAGLWLWPVAAPHPVIGAYRAPPTPYSAGHRGIDIAAPEGTRIRAPADGIVHFAGVVVDRPLLSIDQGEGVLTSFEPVEPLVAAGDAVRRGDVIGVLRPGHCDEPCLHFGVRVDGEYVSPLRYLGGVPRAILLPMRGGGARAPAGREGG